MYNVVNNDCDKNKLDQNITHQCIPGTLQCLHLSYSTILKIVHHASYMLYWLTIVHGSSVQNQLFI